MSAAWESKQKNHHFQKRLLVHVLLWAFVLELTGNEAQMHNRNAINLVLFHPDENRQSIKFNVGLSLSRLTFSSFAPSWRPYRRWSCHTTPPTKTVVIASCTYFFVMVKNKWTCSLGVSITSYNNFKLFFVCRSIFPCIWSGLAYMFFFEWFCPMFVELERTERLQTGFVGVWLFRRILIKFCKTQQETNIFSTSFRPFRLSPHD